MKMAKLNYIGKPCKRFYQTPNGPSPCLGRALRGKDYCRRHRPIKRITLEVVNEKR